MISFHFCLAHISGIAEIKWLAAPKEQAVVCMWKKRQRQNACGVWVQDMMSGFGLLFLLSYLQEALSPRVMLMQGRASGKADSLASHQADRQKLGLRRKEVSFRICTLRTLPFLLWPHLQPPCARSSPCFDSHLTKQSTSQPPLPLLRQHALTPPPNS